MTWTYFQCFSILFTNNITGGRHKKFKDPMLCSIDKKKTKYETSVFFKTPFMFDRLILYAECWDTMWDTETGWNRFAQHPPPTPPAKTFWPVWSNIDNLVLVCHLNITTLSSVVKFNFRITTIAYNFRQRLKN